MACGFSLVYISETMLPNRAGWMDGWIGEKVLESFRITRWTLRKTYTSSMASVPSFFSICRRRKVQMPSKCSTKYTLVRISSL